MTWFWRIWPHEHRYERRQWTTWQTSSIWTNTPMPPQPIYHFGPSKCRRCGR